MLVDVDFTNVVVTVVAVVGTVAVILVEGKNVDAIGDATADGLKSRDSNLAFFDSAESAIVIVVLSTRINNDDDEDDGGDDDDKDDGGNDDDDDDNDDESGSAGTTKFSADPNSGDAAASSGKRIWSRLPEDWTESGRSRLPADWTESGRL